MSAGPGTGLVLALRANTAWQEGHPMSPKDTKQMKNKSLGQIPGPIPRCVLADFIATSVPTIPIALSCFGNSLAWEGVAPRSPYHYLPIIQAGFQLFDSWIDRFNHLTDRRDLLAGQFPPPPLFLVEVGLASADSSVAIHPAETGRRRKDLLGEVPPRISWSTSDAYGRSAYRFLNQC